MVGGIIEKAQSSDIIIKTPQCSGIVGSSQVLRRPTLIIVAVTMVVTQRPTQSTIFQHYIN